MTIEPPVSASQERRAETRWPAFAGIVAAAVLTASVPQPETVAVRTVGLIALAAMAIPLFVVNPHRLDRQTQWSRALAIAFAAVLVIVNQASVVNVIVRLLDGSADGAVVLLEAGQVWATNIIAFGLLFWELDRGGPVARGTQPRSRLPLADFAFPQDDQATPPPRSPPARPAVPTGVRASSTTCTCRSPTRSRSAPPTPCRFARERSC